MLRRAPRLRPGQLARLVTPPPCVWHAFGVPGRIGPSTCFALPSAELQRCRHVSTRALYFTWWDRLAGTFQGSHRLVKEYDTHEALQYEARVVTVPLRKLRQAVLNWGYKVAVD